MMSRLSLRAAGVAALLFALIVVYTINFIDRQILGILAIPIQADLNLSDTQLGAMRGLSFALLYSTLGVPVAMLADRMNRVWIMTAALTVWSAFTIACGTATGFVHLFLARMGVGVGEAGGVAPAYSIVSAAPCATRLRVMAISSSRDMVSSQKPRAWR
jgi:MFS family permease